MITSHLLYPTELSSGGADRTRTCDLMLRKHLLYSSELPPPSCERRRASLGIHTGRARVHRAGSIPRRCDLSFHRSRIDACRQASIHLALAGAEFVVFTLRTPKKQNAPGASLPRRSQYTGGRIEPTSIKTMSGRIRARKFALRHRAGERVQAATSDALHEISVVGIDMFHDRFQ